MGYPVFYIELQDIFTLTTDNWNKDVQRTNVPVRKTRNIPVPLTLCISNANLKKYLSIIIQYFKLYLSKKITFYLQVSLFYSHAICAICFSTTGNHQQ